MARPDSWSKEETDFLVANYNILSSKDLVRHLKRFSKQQIYSKANVLDLRKINYKWSLEEVDILQKNYSKIPLADLMKLLPNRTYSSIITKAGKMKLDVYKEKWSDEEIAILKENYPSMSANELLNYLPKRSNNTIIDMANNLGLRKNEDYYDKEHYEREKLLSDLIKFAEKLGRTPHQKEISENKEMAGYVTYFRYFGSYNNACIKAGLKPNNQIFGRSLVTVDEDGTYYLSEKEKLITNFFKANDIKYIKSENLLYSDFYDDERFGMRRFDWLVEDNVIVEYFGMMDKDYYKERTEYKINLCKELNIPMVELYPEDLKNDFEGLKTKFADLIN